MPNKPKARRFPARSRAGRNDKYMNDPDTWCAHGEVFGKAAAALFSERNPFFCFPAALVGHQALEMLLKAALLRRGLKIGEIWGHDLVELANRLASNGAHLHDEVIDVAKTFNTYFEELRYPREPQNVGHLGKADGERLKDAISYVLPYARRPKVNHEVAAELIKAGEVVVS